MSMAFSSSRNVLSVQSGLQSGPDGSRESAPSDKIGRLMIKGKAWRSSCLPVLVL